MRSTTSRLYEAIKDFPDPVLAEIVDFAEFLRERRLKLHSARSVEPLIKLAGSLENSQSFFAKDMLGKFLINAEVFS